MRTGLERLCENPSRYLRGARAGLVANPTTVDRRLRHAADLLHAHPDVDLRLLFGPEHGIRGAAQDMIAAARKSRTIDRRTRVRVRKMLRSDITRPLNAKPASLRVQRADSFNTEVWIPAVSRLDPCP